MRIEHIREKLESIDKIEGYKNSFKKAILNQVQNISTIDKLFLENTINDSDFTLQNGIEQILYESNSIFNSYINKIKTELEQ